MDGHRGDQTKTLTTRLAATALAVAILFLPAGLSAKERRGAKLVVTRLDGSQVKGELISVRPDSLLLLSDRGGNESIDLAAIGAVRVVRRSRAGLFSALGGAAGVLTCALAVMPLIHYHTTASDIEVFGGLGGLGAGLGALLGSMAGKDSSFAVAGKTEGELSDFWKGLRAYSREGRSPGTPPGPAPKPEQDVEPRKTKLGEAQPAAATGRRKRPRFRLSLAGSYHRQWTPLRGQGSFRFPEEIPPEAGPYAVALTGGSNLNPGGVAWGPVSLACEWGGHWSAEIELSSFGHSNVEAFDFATFTSGADGRTYGVGLGYFGLRTDLLSLLVGLNYRPVSPSMLRRHVVEAGAAAGPCFLLWGSSLGPVPSAAGLPKLALCGRARVAYDFYMVRSFSVGAFAGYRFLEMELPGWAGTTTARFQTTSDPPAYLDRLTEFIVEPITIRMSGPFFGIRIGFRL